jgi:hypothetical protein
MARRCSQCGQVGHNSRNRNCPINIADIESRQQREHSLLEVELECRLDLIFDTIGKWARMEIGIREFMSDIVPMVTEACISMTNVMTHGFDVSDNFTRLSSYSDSINRIVHRYGRSRFSIWVSITEGGVFNEITYRQPLAYIGRAPPVPPPVPMPMPSFWLKDISLVTATGVACECPICFDAVSADASISTNCGHGFCGTCINGLATANKKPSCPMCREAITELKMGSQEVLNEIQNHISALSTCF